jgi:hypothetical protein
LPGTGDGGGKGGRYGGSRVNGLPGNGTEQTLEFLLLFLTLGAAHKRGWQAENGGRYPDRTRPYVGSTYGKLYSAQRFVHTYFKSGSIILNSMVCDFFVIQIGENVKHRKPDLR